MHSNTMLHCLSEEVENWTTNVSPTFLWNGQKDRLLCFFHFQPFINHYYCNSKVLEKWAQDWMFLQCQITIKVSKCTLFLYFYHRPVTNGSQTSLSPSTMLRAALNWWSLNSSSVVLKGKFWNTVHVSLFSTKTQSQQRLKSNLNKAPKTVPTLG